ncbi:hypothetical protein [Macrococcus capreoli]|uniref:hypothetical protein n=1 Tax=Macrococcus capreoli TaxID=2982690 RepID=UPI003EE525AB
MNIFTSRLDNIEIGSKKAFSVVPKDIKNIEGYIGNIKYLDAKLERVIDHAINHSDFISKAQKALLISKPLFTFLYPSNEKDFKNENKESKDSYYMYKDLYLHNLTVAFALGLWLVKDNAVNVNHSYHFNPLINYNSTYNRTLSFTLSSGEIKSTYYSENEINNSISLMYDIYSILLKNVDLLKISSS